MLDAPLFVAAAERTARAVMEHLQSDGFLAGEFDSEWRPQGPWACLTGTAQMAIIWWRLYELRGDPRYADAARRATSYVLCRQELTRGGPATRGGIAGSFPVGARYGRYQFLNWAAKFLVDALLLEERCGTSSSRQTMVPDRAAAR